MSKAKVKVVYTVGPYDLVGMFYMGKHFLGMAHCVDKNKQQWVLDGVSSRLYTTEEVALRLVDDSLSAAKREIKRLEGVRALIRNTYRDKE